MKTLPISDTLKLPLDAVTQKFAFLGRTGSGKTYAATKLAELMLDAGAQVVVLDPVGVWHGLRLGDRPLSIYVFGGLHGDVPLEPTGGALVADLVVDEHVSAVLDLSQMIPAELCRFATDFSARFFQRKKVSPGAVHLVIEECQEFVPQNPMRGEEHMLHNFERLVKLGRNFGIGVSLVSQRPQEVNKKALNQTECMFAFQMTGPQERKAVSAWVDDKGLSIDVKSFLPRLKVGHAHVWSPQWLEFSGEVAVSKKRTADVSATPKVGDGARRAKSLSPVDLDAVRAQMAETIERAKAEDPKELKKKVVELERELAKKSVPAKVEPKVVEVPVFAKGEVRELKDHLEELRGLHESLEKAARELAAAVVKAVAEEAKPGWSRVVEMKKRARTFAEELHESDRKRASSGAAPQAVAGLNGLGKQEKKILTAFYWTRDEVATPDKISFYSSYRASSGGFNSALGKLRKDGFVQGWKITDAGVALAESVGVGPKPSGRELREWLRPKLGHSENVLLDVLCEVHPRRLSNDDLAQAANYSAGSGGFNSALGHLRAIDAVEGQARDGGSKAADIFFDA